MLYLTKLIDTDGFGAQYQKIIGVIALSKKYDCEYVHSTIKEIEHISSVLSVNNYFNICGLYKRVEDISFDKTFNVINNEIESAILSLKQHAINTNENILLIINNPLGILDTTTSLYNPIMSELRKIKQNLELVYFKSTNVNIAVHIRRGDVNPTIYPYRYTPTSYFKHIIDRLLKQYPTANICIFTEITDENKDEFLIFTDPAIHIVSGGDALVAFEHLVKADVLVMSKSSFSYIAGLYNEKNVLYTPFWHNPLNHWNIV
jgi:hypothetical protein